VHPPNDITMQNNSLYHPANTFGTNLQIGYQPQNASQNLVIQNNDVIGATAINVGGFQTATVTGNTFFSDGDMLCTCNTLPLTGYTYTWNNNTYFNGKSSGNIQYVFGFNGKLNSLGGGMLKWDDLPGHGWRQWSGFDANSTYTLGRPTGTKVAVHANMHQSGRAHIAIYNWGKLASVNVDLSTAGLTDGQVFELRSAQNYLGLPVYVGTYSAANPVVAVPMNSAEALAVATPLFHVFTPGTTAPEFAALVVLVRGTPNSAPVAPANLTAAGGNQQVRLSWNTATGATSYSVKRSLSSGGSYATVQSGRTSTSWTNTGLSNGTTYYYVVGGVNDFGESLSSNQASVTPAPPDTIPPRVVWASFDYTVWPNKVIFTFSEDVSESLSTADVQVQNLTNPGPVIVSGLWYNGGTNTATFTFALPILSDGNYRATLLASGITDAAGNHVDGNGDGTGGDNYVYDFFLLVGDANHDRKVDITDLGIVGTNWQQSQRTWSQGDFNYDGLVDITDLGMVGSNWQTQLAPPPENSSAPSLAPVLSRSSTRRLKR
jgi:hypothetical protein